MMLLLSILTGCGSGDHHVATAAVVPYLSGNWQIQSASGDAAPGVLLVGNLASADPLVIPAPLSGTLRFTDLEVGNLCGMADAPVVFTGASSDDTGITLAGKTVSGSIIQITLSVPPATFVVTPGYVEVSGPSCNYARSAVTALHVGLVGGTFRGTVTTPYSLSGGTLGTGTAALTLTHSNQADAQGRFPVSGTLSFVGKSCNAYLAVSGTESGLVVDLASAPDPVTGVSDVVIDGTTDVTAVKYTSTIEFNAGACSTSYSGFNTYGGELDAS